MKIRRIDRLRRAIRKFRNSYEGVILLYHRVAELPLDPHLLGVTPQHFAEHLEIFRKHGHPMRLQQLIQALHDGNLPHRAVVVTLDDGYADNLYNAMPLLERYGIPATVFVPTGYIGHERDYWWDELGRVLLQPGTLPETLRLKINGSPYQWELGEWAHYGEDDYRRHQCWNIKEKGNPGPRQRLFRSLFQLLVPLPEGEQRKVLDELLAWAGAESMGRPTHRTLTPEELTKLAEGGLVELGAHTMTHPVLSVLPVEAQRAEIQGSKARLEEILGCPVTSFAYPYGGRSHYTAETLAIVRETGFACACSAFADFVWQGTKRFELPRVYVRDWDGDEFARRLRAFFSA